MNQGGEPGHDDYGLPWVDIQIPDDARELERDVQAYHRELRAQRRHERGAWLRSPLRTGGIVVPLIAGCLVLAMVAGMVLTMFSANPYFSKIAGPDSASTGAAKGAPGSTTGPASTTPATSGLRSSSPRSVAPRSSSPRSVPSGRAGGQLPAKTIIVAGRPVALRTLTPSVLAMVPAHCRCATAVGRLLSQARTAGITIYLVGNRASQHELSGLAPTAGFASAHVAIDAGDNLYRAYHPVGLSVLLVDARGTVVVVANLPAGFQLRQQFDSLKSAR